MGPPRRPRHNIKVVIPESIDAKTSELVRTFAGNQDGLALPIRDWYQLFPQSFYRIAPKELRPDRDVLIFQLMLSDTECCRYLCDAGILDMPSAIELARNLFAVGQHLDIRLAHAAIEWAERSTDRESLRRCLQLLDSLKPGDRINDFLVPLLTSRDAFVRSKAFDLLLQSSNSQSERRATIRDQRLPSQFQRTWEFNETHVREWLKDPDPRVRANLIEVLGKMYRGVEWVRQALLDHLSDPHGRVVANSAVALFQMGNEDEAIDRLCAMASSQDADGRNSAAWAMGQIAHPKFPEILNKLRTDRDSRVRWNALKSLKRVHKGAIRNVERETNLELPGELATGTGP